MTLLDLLTAFEETDKKLNTAEVALFISLALVWNRLRRPEWFSVSRTELMHKAGMTDAKRVDRTRQSLEEKGLILTQTGGRTSPRKYHIIPLEAHSPQSKGSQPLEARGSQPLEDIKVKKARGSQPLDKGLTALRLGAHSPTSQREYTEANLSASSVHGTTYIDSRRKESNIPEVPKEVLDAYQDEIRPIYSHFELSKLADDVQHYGSEAVVKAIHRATLRNKRTLAYVEGILKRWENEGYDNEEGKHAERSKDNRTTNDEDELDRWAEELTRGL